MRIFHLWVKDLAVHSQLIYLSPITFRTESNRLSNQYPYENTNNIQNIYSSSELTDMELILNDTDKIILTDDTDANYFSSNTTNNINNYNNINNIDEYCISADVNNNVLPPMSAEKDIQTSGSSRSYILIVDDSVSTRKMQNRLLTSYNYTCMEATDGAHALEVFKENMLSENENRFGVILMDYQMPVMDGPTAIKLIRSQGYTGLIIGVTGNVLDEDRIIMLNAGANYVMSKPFDIHKFELIMKMIANS